jgi:hypothetical protein
MRSLQKLVMVLLVGGAGAGCSEWVQINSAPQGARCYVDGAMRGRTPLRTVVESTATGPNPRIRLAKKGYHDYIGILKKKAQPGKIAADLMLGSLSPLAMAQNAALVSGDYSFDLVPKDPRTSDGVQPGRADDVVRLPVRACTQTGTTRGEVAREKQASADRPRTRTRRVRRRSARRSLRSASPTGGAIHLEAATEDDMAVNQPIDMVPVRRLASANSRAATGQITSAGPRFGLLYITGEAAETLKTEYDAQPIVTAWGWQIEYQYETSPDGPTGLVEFVPLIAGMEQGLAIPTANILLGLRTANDKEFVVGPNVSPSGIGLTVAVGKTFHAGPLNLPVNLAIVSNGQGIRYSVTFGWNIRQ